MPGSPATSAVPTGAAVTPSGNPMVTHNPYVDADLDADAERRPSGRLCPLCQTAADVFEPGPNGRPDARCATCQSLERHRFFGLLLDRLRPVLSVRHRTLDIAPQRQVQSWLRQTVGGSYLATDLEPGLPISARADLCSMPMASDTFDLIICYHVLEHIPDDRAAMRELVRILAPGGFAIVQVPWRATTLTEEDPSASHEERIRRFGQSDHVRYYGTDFADRLTSQGLENVMITPAEIVDETDLVRFGLQPLESVWFCHKRLGSAQPDRD